MAELNRRIASARPRPLDALALTLSGPVTLTWAPQERSNGTQTIALIAANVADALHGAERASRMVISCTPKQRFHEPVHAFYSG